MTRIPLLTNGKLRTNQPSKHIEVDGIRYKMNKDGVINIKYGDTYSPIKYFLGFYYASQQEFDRIYSMLILTGGYND